MDSLKGRQYLNLVTRRKNGEEVGTPMWFAVVGDKLYMTTRGNSGKVKRIGNHPQVTIARSSASGREQGPRLTARARVVEEESLRQQAVAALNKKYGLKKKLVDLALKFSKDKTEAILELEL